MVKHGLLIVALLIGVGSIQPPLEACCRRSKTPAMPASPSPIQNASGVATTVVLSWAKSANADTYDVFFSAGTTPDTQVSSAQTGLTFTPATPLINGQTYAWQVAARNASRVVTGPVWTFTVITGPPGTPSLIAPGNGSVGADITVDLQWAATNATTCDVLFGLVAPPVSVVSSGQGCATYDPGTLAYSTLYYWQIVAHNASGSATSAIFSFTTMPMGGGGGGGGGQWRWSTGATWTGGFKGGPCPSSTACGTLPGANLAYAGLGLGFASSSSLYVSGSDGTVSALRPQLTAEISIPASLGVGTTGTAYTTWPNATFLQPFNDPTEGGATAIGTQCNSPAHTGDYLVYGGYLWVTTHCYYDANNRQTTSHFRRPLNLSTTGSVVGGGGFIFSLAANGSAGSGLQDYDRWMNGWLAAIPMAWQAPLGGKIYSGLITSNISGGSSQGPSALAWNPDTFVAGTNANTAVPSVYYTLQHPIIGGGYQPCSSAQLNCPPPIAGQVNYMPTRGDPSTVWNSATKMIDAVFVDGTRTLLVFEIVGTGIECYGNGVTQQGTIADPFPTGTASYCYDPSNPAKGAHAYPYRVQVKHYDANDFLNTIGGAYPWLPQPYATDVITLPFERAGAPLISGVAYDAATQRIIIAQPQSSTVNGSRPFYHVFTLTVP